MSTKLLPLSRLEYRVEGCVLHVSGAVDLSTMHVFHAALERCESDPCVQALDLSGVEFFSAVGARCFADRGWPTRPHVPIIASRLVRRVLTMCDMEFLLAPHGWLRDRDHRAHHSFGHGDLVHQSAGA